MQCMWRRHAAVIQAGRATLHRTLLLNNTSSRTTKRAAYRGMVRRVMESKVCRVEPV